MKRILKILLIGTCLGLVLSALQQGLSIDRSTFLRSYWILAAAIVIGAVLINIGYNLFYHRKIQQIVPLLYEGRPQDYITQMEALLKKAKGKGLRALLTLDLAAGYVETKQFDVAIPMLEGLSLKQLKGAAVQVVHRINLCLCYFESGQHEKALALYQEAQPLFQNYRDSRSYGGSIATLDVIAAILQKQYPQAEELLTQAQQTYQDARLQKAFGELADTLQSLRQDPQP